MAHYFGKDRWKRRAGLALSVALTASLSLGIFAACANDTTSDDSDDETTTTQTDTQKIRNGNFEFYSEMDEDLADKRDLISSPTNWTLSSGSPTSDTSSGIVDMTEWDTLTASGSAFFENLSTQLSDATADMSDTEEEDYKDTFFPEHIDDVVAHWEDDDVTVYDRLRFYSEFENQIDDLDSDSDAAQLFADYEYTIDFEDVQYLAEDLGETAPALHEGVKEDESAVLMVHNRRTSDGVVGTGQHYTSGTTITLDAGTSAELTVWVRTDALDYSYEDMSTVLLGGAYIEVAQTVGGTSLDDWRIENIRTDGEWQQYKLSIRACSFAETTFTVTLGLGKGTSDDRYESINGYAFFDDLTCTVIPNSEFDETPGDDYTADLNSKGDDKVFDDSALKVNENYARTFSLDLYMDSANFDLENGTQQLTTGITEEISGSKTYTSKIKDNRNDIIVAENKRSMTGYYTFDELQNSSNLYLQNVVEKDFLASEGGSGFPFTNPDGTINGSEKVLLLLSTNGAAYTAKLSAPDTFTLEKDEYMLVSFWVKTSDIRSGATGASVTLVDGENRTTISAFDSNAADTVDIDDDTTDIYNGWVQCFFYVANETDTQKTFSLEFHYGPTEVSTAELSAYADGYAAFTGFETSTMTSTQYGYAATTDYAQKVSLTGSVDNDSQFDSASATTDIEKELAKPVSFQGVQAGSNVLDPGEDGNPAPSNPTSEELAAAGIYTGMLNAKYADTYRNLDEDWVNALKKVTETSGEYANGEAWWQAAFGSGTAGSRVANQPLLIYNSGDSAAASYGYILRSSQTVSADSAQRISVRVKLSEGATATVYLIDTSDAKAGYSDTLTPDIPAVTYWYDDNGNIVNKDPASDDFNSREDVLYYLADNGLYYKAGTSESDENVVYYANLANYERDEEGNYVTSDGTIAFYHNPADEDEDSAYAYRTEVSTGNYTYSQPVTPLSSDESIPVRYTAPTDASAYGTAIEVKGSDASDDGWVEVVFYVQAGSEEKNYRLEVWAGSRTNKDNGLPAGEYVFFDAYTSESTSDYDTLLSEAVDELKQDKTNLVDPKDPDSNLKDALYYTFTFYDSVDYLRYDVNEDEDELGNPYGSYTQSAYSEEIVYLKNGTTMFLNYGATDVTVEQDDLGSSDDTTTDDSTADTSDTNIWLVISSSVLAVVLLFAIVAIIVRRVHSKVKKHAKVKPAKAPKAKKPARSAEPEAPETDEPETAADENDPYND